MIECTFRSQAEFPCLINKSGKTKLGRYHSSSFAYDEGYPVAVYIDGSFKQYLDSGKTQEEIIKECIEYLNNQTEGIKKKKSIYGVLTFGQFSFKMNVETGEYFIIALLTTSDPKNKNFWGEGKK